MMGFKKLSIVTASLALVLFSLLLVLPEIIFFIFQIPETDSAFFISRRAAMLFLGIAILSWLGRNSVHSDLRQAVCMGLAVAMIGLATTGTFEYVRGYAGAGIGLAIIVETIIGISYFKIWLANQKS